MKYLFLYVLCLTTTVAMAQNIDGQWNGALDINGSKLRIVFNISTQSEQKAATMDSPDQQAYGIKADSVTFRDSSLVINFKSLYVTYKGKLTPKGTFDGVFMQGAFMAPMKLSREKIAKKVRIREQDPRKPYPYIEDSVTFVNQDENIKLSGTLTMPHESVKGGFPAVILVSGSGPQDRNEEIVNHRPFLVLADYLTARGVAVLRYDDRGTGLSQGEFNQATTHNFASDALWAIRYLASRKEINADKIGVIGHSEGGIVAPIVAADNASEVAFIVLMAGPGVAGDSILLMQSDKIGLAQGVAPSDLQRARNINRSLLSMIRNGVAQDSILKRLQSQMTITSEQENQQLRQQLKAFQSPWMNTFITLDPHPYLVRVKCPVLALNGDLDLQVPSVENLSAIKSALLEGGNTRHTIRELPRLNHLFQECQTGAPSEYEKIEQTISSEVLEIIDQWIKTVFP